MRVPSPSGRVKHESPLSLRERDRVRAEPRSGEVREGATFADPPSPAPLPSLRQAVEGKRHQVSLPSPSGRGEGGEGMSILSPPLRGMGPHPCPLSGKR